MPPLSSRVHTLTIPSIARRPAFEPKLLTVLREGYTARQFARDLLAGTIVGVVALPLAIAFAIASGVKPEQIIGVGTTGHGNGLYLIDKEGRPARPGEAWRTPGMPSVSLARAKRSAALR